MALLVLAIIAILALSAQIVMTMGQRQTQRITTRTPRQRMRDTRRD